MRLQTKLTRAGSAVGPVSFGGDPMIGTQVRGRLPLFEADPQTEVIVMVGRSAAVMRRRGADFIRR